METKIFQDYLVLILFTFCVNCLKLINATSRDYWSYHHQVDSNFVLFWNVTQGDIVMEFQVKALGLVGIGFSQKNLDGADAVFGWVKDGKAHLQVDFNDYSSPFQVLRVIKIEFLDPQV